MASEKINSKMNGYLLKIQFSFKDENKKFNTNNEFIINENNHEWTPLTLSKNGVALLGKIHEVNKGSFTAEYMVIDTETAPVKLQSLGLVNQLGKQGEIKSENLPQKVSISLLATPVEYNQQRQ